MARHQDSYLLRAAQVHWIRLAPSSAANSFRIRSYELPEDNYVAVQDYWHGRTRFRALNRVGVALHALRVERRPLHL